MGGDGCNRVVLKVIRIGDGWGEVEERVGK
jgi:hypothetical protein